MNHSIIVHEIIDSGKSRKDTATRRFEAAPEFGERFDMGRLIQKPNRSKKSFPATHSFLRGS
jgi:hypothetical protein